MRTSLDKKVFLALASIVWAGGDKRAAAADALLRAALDELGIEDVAELEEALSSVPPEVAMDRTIGSKENNLYAFAIGHWLGLVEPSEAGDIALSRLADKLGVPERSRAIAESIVVLVHFEAGNEVSRFDFTSLRSRLQERLVKK